MKKLMTLLALSLFVLIGCDKEELILTKLDYDQAEKYSAFVFNDDGANPVWELSSLNVAENSLASSATYRSNSMHTHGDFHGYGPGGVISFSGTQNNGGAHGSAEVQITFGPYGSAHVIMETVSVVSIGDKEVIYGGIITEVIENTIMLPPPPPCPTFPNCPPPPPAPCDLYDAGTYTYFAVKDNGQGNNALPDQYRAAIINSCFELSNGGADIPWAMFPLIDIGQASDKIKVNN